MTNKNSPILIRRRKHLLNGLNLGGCGIEYGPLFQPCVTREMSRVKYVDYTTRDELMRIYRNQKNFDPLDIVDVDIVTSGKRIIHFVEANSVDYIVASHVAEHVPDLITWLDDNLSILKVGGHLSIAFPDKRYCFDMKRNSSTVSELIAAWIEKRTMPSFSTFCDYYYNVVQATPIDVWSNVTTLENARYCHSRDTVIDTLKQKYRRIAEGNYENAHCWVFTDEEFVKRITGDELRPLFSQRFTVESYLPTQPKTNGFYIIFRKTA